MTSPARRFRSLLSAVARPFLNLEPCATLVDWIAYERKRVRRRKTAARLEETGKLGDTILSGAFQGMRYPESGSSCGIEKILGAYEAELREVVEEIAGRPYSEIIDVGCAEGYYAVGMAMRQPEALVYAFDTNPRLLAACRRLASANQVEARLRFGSLCTPETLAGIEIRRKGFLLCDCEGYELQLLDPNAVPLLKELDILVETHDFVDPSITGTLRDRFRPTHEIRTIHSHGPRPADYPQLGGLSSPEIESLLWEDRPAPMDWLVLTSLSG